MKKFEEDYFSGGKSNYTPEYLEKGIGNAVHRRLSRLLKYVQNPDNKRILDIGCALGHFLRACEKVGFETYGVDISNYAIQKATQLTKTSRLYIIDVEVHLPFPDEFFNVVTLFDVVEHLKSPIKVLREISRILASGGIIYLTTPNPRGLGRSFLSRFSQKWKDKDATHININPAGFWLNVLQENNFRILEAKFLIENLLGRFDVAFPLFGGTTHIIAVKLRDKRRSSRLEDIPCCR